LTLAEEVAEIFREFDMKKPITKKTISRNGYDPKNTLMGGLERKKS